MEQENYAIIRGVEGEEREVQTNPLTNYNVVTVDQNLPNNSTVTLINTNVIREGAARDANVTGLLFDIHNRANAYAVRGEVKHSRQYEPGNDRNGHALDFQLARISGQWTWELGYGEESDTYDVNDLGILFANNSRYWRGELDYSQPESFMNGFFLNGRTGLDLDYRRLFAPSRYTGVNVRGYARATTRHFWDLYISSRNDVGDQYDYFEPRVRGRYWRVPGYNNLSAYVGTDGRKKLRVSLDVDYNRYLGDGKRRGVSLGMDARYRFNNRLSMSAYAYQGSDRNDVGYVNQADLVVDELERTDVYFGTRDRNSVEAGLNGKYSFSANMTLNLRLRHYWSGVAYRRFHLLDADGLLADTDYTGSHDQDFDAFNVDLIYRWRFAPGSDIFVVYKGSISDFDERKSDDYFGSFSQLWGRDVPRSGSLSVKMVYWLDYASLFPG